MGSATVSALKRTKIEHLIEPLLLSRNRLNSLAFRLFATSVAWTFIALPVAGFIVYYNYSQNIIFNFERSIRVHLISIEAQNSGKKFPIKAEYLGETGFSFTNSGWYWQIQPLIKGQGKRLASDSLANGYLPSPRSRNVQELEPGLRKMDTIAPDGQPVRLFEQIGRLSNHPEAPQYSFIVAGPLDLEYAKISAFAWELTIALGVAALGLLVATFLQVRFGLFPLRSIEQGLADVRSGKAVKLDSKLPIEIEPLQSELNALIDSNQDIIDRARTQVGNLAHALKTPLAIITNEATEERSPFARKVAEQARIMNIQITNYLNRACVAARAGGVGRVCKVDTVVKPLKRALERIYRDKGVAISLECSESARFRGEQHDLEEVLGNLLDNACKWCRCHVRLRITEHAGEAGGKRMLEFIIEDDGPGLDANQRQKIGKRGVRLDETMPGTGLGLSIVSDLITSYRGTLNLDTSELGGLKVVARLPAVEDHCE